MGTAGQVLISWLRWITVALVLVLVIFHVLNRGSLCALGLVGAHCLETPHAVLRILVSFRYRRSPNAIISPRFVIELAC